QAVSVAARSRAAWCAGSPSAATTAPARASASPAKSMSCQGVSVPPQSKMTAATSGDLRETGGRACRDPTFTSGADDAGDLGDRLRRRDLLPLVGAPVLDLDIAVGQAAAHGDDGGHADQLRVLELHAG